MTALVPYNHNHPGAPRGQAPPIPPPRYRYAPNNYYLDPVDDRRRTEVDAFDYDAWLNQPTPTPSPPSVGYDTDDNRTPVTVNPGLLIGGCVLCPLLAIGIMTALIYPQAAVVVLVALVVALVVTPIAAAGNVYDARNRNQPPPIHSIPSPRRRPVPAQPGGVGATMVESGKYPPPLSSSQHTAHTPVAALPLGNKGTTLRTHPRGRR